MKRNNKNKFNTNPFVIHGVIDAYKGKPIINNWVNYHTHGLSDYGLTELSIVCPDAKDPRPYEIINIVGRMMISGEKFNPDLTHAIEDGHGIPIYRFRLKPTTCFGDKSLRIIIPDKDTDMFIDDSPYAMQSLDIFEDLINEDLVDARG